MPRRSLWKLLLLIGWLSILTGSHPFFSLIRPIALSALMEA